MSEFRINDSVTTDDLTRIPEKMRGAAISLKDYNPAVYKQFIADSKMHDANFTFLTSELAKLDPTAYEPITHTTWEDDIPVDVGGGYIEKIEYYTTDWAGLMNEQRNIFGNNGNYIPRVNASRHQKTANVHTFKIAYDLDFIEMEKFKKVKLTKSIQSIYNEAIDAMSAIFIQNIAYTGFDDTEPGLFNNDSNVLITAIANNSSYWSNQTTDSDVSVVSFFNGVIMSYLKATNNDPSFVPDTFLVPMSVINSLVSRMSTLYTNNLYNYILEFNVAVPQIGKKIPFKIVGRQGLETAGVAGKGRIVAYKKDKRFLHIYEPVPCQHFITQPNIDRCAYTTIFAGQVSQIVMPYNTDAGSLGAVTYWDFTA
jgi:hypothetical protein